MIPSNSMLSEVIISAKPIGGLFILNRVIDNFPKNLSYQPFNYFVYYKGKEQDSYGGKANIIEAAIKTYYDKGYSENSKKGFTIINKKEITKSMNKLTMSWPWWGLLNGEIHQNRQIWNKNRLINYVIDIVDTVYQNDDLIYVIDYKSKKQDFKTTGYSNVKSASGSLYISRKDYAVLSHKMTFTFRGIDDKIIAENSKRKHDEITTLKFQYEVSYKNINGKYYVALVDFESMHRVDRKNGTLDIIKGEHKLLVSDIELKSPQPLETYIKEIDQAPFDPEFWRTFNTIISEEKNKENKK